jgi:hypothetical protein
MDNIFQLLIFLFIIYTIFNAVFGKKKPQRTGGNIPQRQPEEVKSDTSPRTASSSGDILEELFGFKIPKTGGEYETHSPNRYPSNLETELPDLDSQPGVENRNIPDVDYDKLPSLELQQNVTSATEYHSAYEVTNTLNKRTKDVIAKIKNPTTLRELYLISEILNKPKALRK